MNEKLAMNAATQTTADVSGSGGKADVHTNDDSSVAAKIRLVELEALVGNLYLAKEVVSKPVAGEQIAYNANQQ